MKKSKAQFGPALAIENPIHYALNVLQSVKRTTNKRIKQFTKEYDDNPELFERRLERQYVMLDEINEALQVLKEAGIK